MKTSVFNLSFKRLGTAVALSFLSLLTINQVSLASEMLDMVEAKLQREGKIIVDGDPSGLFYTIRGMALTFAGESCPINGTCSYVMSVGAWIYDPELNQALGRACRDQNNYSVICNLDN
ncbi:MAG: hypothetical protein NDM07_08830 [Planktothrix agardhii LY1]|uniref:hypothetical protein n=1 Tax=Planktothrix agardhii TaxID=1160 RepID=UPI00242DB240|nr:hypothetical protein [Planktothrix agardhii]MCP9294777.1 hypothetical protein [Planktothrix agardhii LY1]